MNGPMPYDVELLNRALARRAHVRERIRQRRASELTLRQMRGEWPKWLRDARDIAVLAGFLWGASVLCALVQDAFNHAVNVP